MRVLKSLFLLFLLVFLSGCAFGAVEEKTTVKVGISNNNFATYEHSRATFVLSGISSVTDMSNEGNKLNLDANQNVEITLFGEYFNVDLNGKNMFKDSKGPIVITSNSKIGIKDINRKGDPANYKGIIELIPVAFNKFNIVNILDMQTYLKGVVPNEMPVSFGIEALKAQAVAARNYANRPNNVYKYYDVCDSVACQVYYGANSETALSNRAVDETKGVYALYKNEIILALYSSTPSGITENYIDTFGKGIEDKPYLKSITDNKNLQELKDENEIAQFFKENVPSFDMKSPKHRWQKKFDRFELEDILTKTLKEQSKAGAVTPVFDGTKQIWGLEDIEVLRRGASYKALDIKIKSASGDYIIKKELPIRRVFKYDNQILPSSNFVVEKEYNKNEKNIDDTDDVDNESQEDDFMVGHKINEQKKLFKSRSGRKLPSAFVFYGAGFGHGVGLSQYGAGYLSSYGVGFESILKHYYKGINIGTVPKEVKYNNINVNYVQDFYFSKNKTPKTTVQTKSPLQKEINELINYEKDERCFLVIENPDGVSRIEFFINDYYFDPSIDGYNKRYLKTDITKYVKNGDNRIYFRPLNENNKKKTVRFYVVFGEKHE